MEVSFGLCPQLSMASLVFASLISPAFCASGTLGALINSCSVRAVSACACAYASVCLKKRTVQRPRILPEQSSSGTAGGS
jgi:hypothetical protein